MVYRIYDVGELNSRGLNVKVKVAYDELLRCGFLDLVMWVN